MAGAEAAPEKYWFWRDRKGLLGNPLSLLSNFVFLYGVLTWIAAQIVGAPWGLAKYSLHPWLLVATLAIQIIQSSVRMGCSRPALRPAVRAGGSATRGLRQLDQHRRHLESRPLLRAGPHSP